MLKVAFCATDMANLPAAGMKSLGERLGLDGWSNERINVAYEAIAEFQMRHHTSVQMVSLPGDPPVRNTRAMDLNIKQVSPDNESKLSGIHLFDIITNYEGAPLPKEQVVQMMRGNAYKELPPPLCAKEDFDFGYTMNVNIHEQADGKVSIVKWFIFEQRTDLKLAIGALCYGQACLPQWVGSSDLYKVKKVMLYLFERLPGTNVLYTRWSHNQSDKANQASLVDLNKRRAGYEFIRTKGPKANNVNQFVEWTDEFVNREDSPIFGWSKGEVKESLSNYSKGATAARTLYQWPATLQRLEPIVLEKLAIPTLADHDIHGTMWVGKTRVGKSTASKTTGFTISGHNIKKASRSDLAPCVITCKRIDHLRLEPGSKFKPAIADDIPVHRMDPDEIKAFGDPAEEDALLWARWGGASFEQNQNRQMCFNPYDIEFEASVEVLRNGTQEEISFESFRSILYVNWPKDSTPVDVDAYLARYHIYLMTDKHIYYRYASLEKGNVPRMPWPNPSKPDLFKPETTDVMKRYKKEQNYKPPGYADAFQWDLALMEALSKKKKIPTTITITGDSLFDEKQITTYVYPSMSQLNNLPMPSATNNSGTCGTAEDQRELQSILHWKVIRSGVDGTTIDLTSPTQVSPLQAHDSFCGDASDMEALQAILTMGATALNGQSFEISDEDDDSASPRPPRKKPTILTDGDGFDMGDLHRAKIASLTSQATHSAETDDVLRSADASSETCTDFDVRVSAGLPAPSTRPACNHSDDDFMEGNVFGHSNSFDSP